MALIAKTSAALANTGLAQARAVAPLRQPPSVGDGPIQELNASIGAELDHAVSRFPDPQYERQQQDRSDADNRDRLPGPPRAFVRTPTEAFAALIELDGTVSGEFERAPGEAPRPSVANFGKAIATYEVNERVIYGTEDGPGESLSITL